MSGLFNNDSIDMLSYINNLFDIYAIVFTFVTLVNIIEMQLKGIETFKKLLN